MHPWERDARLLKEDLVKEPPQFNVIIEIACTRSSEELLGARRAYHSLFNQSIEEHISSHLRGVERRVYSYCNQSFSIRQKSHELGSSIIYSQKWKKKFLYYLSSLIEIITINYYFHFIRNFV